MTFTVIIAVAVAVAVAVEGVRIVVGLRQCKDLRAASPGLRRPCHAFCMSASFVSGFKMCTLQNFRRESLRF